MSRKMDKILAEISAGELIDKITILEIKKEKISNKEKLVEVNKELNSLNETLKKSINNESKIVSFKNDLKNINLKLWDIEDGKRSAEKNNRFDDKFIQLARNVYKFNDERAKIKLEINKELISLNETLKKSINDESKILSFKNDLKNINLKLWDIEDGKRLAEKNSQFDEKFIELARSVYKFNDERAKIKSAINESLGSNIKEVKSYE